MMVIKEDNAQVLRNGLKAYADRGVFRSYSETVKGKGQYEFRFRWLGPVPLCFSCNLQNDTLMFKALLPADDKKSVTDKGLRAFLKKRHATKLPDHRRIDADKLKLSCINRAEGFSIMLKLLPGCDYDYAVGKAVNLVSDIFNGFLKQPENGSYVSEHFGIAGE